MPKILAPLAFLALAAGASAQTFTLAPAFTAGYRFDYVYNEQTQRYTSINGKDAIYRPGDILPQNPLTWVSHFGLDAYYSHVTSRINWTEAISPMQVTHHDWRWTAEFALPKTPAGMVLVSAMLTATATDPAGQAGVSVYVGDGLASTADAGSTNSHSHTSAATVSSGVPLDLTDRVSPLLAAGRRYVGFRFTGRSVASQWAAPTLTLTFAPQAVPEPAAFLPLSLGAPALLRRRA